MITRRFAWAHGDGAIQSLGGMLGPVRFHLPGGRVALPFQVAPWADEPGAAALPGILRALRGEWPCVPFGTGAAGPLAGDWAGFGGLEPAGLPPHGHGSNVEWTFEGGLALHVDYPADSPIARLERTIRPDPDAPALDIGLTVVARADVRWPIGLHPTFRVPDSGVVIETGSPGLTYPGAVEPGVSVLAQGARFDSLTQVPRLDGTAQDCSRLPLPFATEELVQLTRPGGRIALACPAEGWRLRMTWDAQVFPGLVIWMSNRGRTASPWNGRHQAVGLEPVCAPFDLGPLTARADNPLARAGHPTAHAFRAGETLTTILRIAVEPL